ncbi:MAG TPA: amidase [Candidatus Latescibacteria bacterium]|nr:amidase [Candidatus Latescibacterota bacterium]
MTNSKVRHAPPLPGRLLAVQGSVLILSLCGQTGSSVAGADSLQVEERDIAALQSLMQEGRLTARELTQLYIDRIATLDDAGPRLNAIIAINPDALEIASALDEERRHRGPRGPMHGIPVILKANIDTGDELTTTAGSLALSGHRASRDAFAVARLRDAGAVILGKANLSEWANFRSTHSTSGWSSQGRQTKNPYVLDRNPCGSSSGSAVAVAASLTAVAIGTETDGSVVCPAGATGIVGIKPTLGLVSRDGIIPIAHSQDTAGPMGRTVRDAAVLLTAMVAADPGDLAAANFPPQLPDYLAVLDGGGLKGVRIGIMRDYAGAGANAGVEARFEEAIGVLAGLGAEIVDPVDLGDREGMDEAEFEVLLYEFRAGLNDYLGDHRAPNGARTLADLIAFNVSRREEVMPFFGQEILVMAEDKGPLTEEAYREALATSKRLAQGAIDGALEGDRLDAIAAPTNGPAWVTDLVNGDNFSVSSSTLAAVSGYANVTVPMGYVRGLPVGLSVFGTAFSEPVLLRITYAFEQAAKARRRPEFLPTLVLE